MAITKERTAPACCADDAGWRQRGQLAEALRSDERTRQIPLIFLSSEAGPANAERAHELGALAYLTKPFDPPALALPVTGAVVRADTVEQPSTPRRAGA